MAGAGAPKPVPRWGLLRPAQAGFGGPRSGAGGRAPVAAVASRRQSSSTKNNQLRTGADKGNPTV